MEGKRGEARGRGKREGDQRLLTAHERGTFDGQLATTPTEAQGRGGVEQGGED